MKDIIKILIILCSFHCNQAAAQILPCGQFQGSPPPAIFSITSGTCNFGQSIQLTSSYYGTSNHSWSISGGNGGAYFQPSTTPMNSPVPPCIVIPNSSIIPYQVTHNCSYINSSGNTANSSYTCTFTVGNYNSNVNYMSYTPSEQILQNTSALTDPVGTVQGNAEVSLNGSATYTIPISTPSGVAGVEPSVAISYNSLGGNGLLGLGWNLAAGSSITRANRDLYHDTEAEAPRLSPGDALILDGNRLVLVNGEYRTKTESFSKITEVSYAGGIGFKVETKGGIVMEYGMTADSRFGSTAANTVIWQLNKTMDKFGNYVEYKYININKTIYLDEIKYTGNANILPSNSIKFEYKMRDDANIGFIAGVPINANLLLTKITIKSENELYSTYTFDYVKDNVQSFLKKVTMGGSNGELLRPTYFKYASNDQPPILEQKTVQGPSSSQGGQATQQYTGDFNGDGKTDLLSVGYVNASWQADCVNFVTQFETGINTFQKNTPVVLPQNSVMGYNSEYANDDQINFLAQDYNGDTYDDVPIIKKSVVLIEGWWYDEDGNAYPIYTPHVSMENLVIYHSSGNGNFNAPVTYNANPISNNYVDKLHFVTGDFNGDGLVDYLTTISDGNHYHTYVSFPELNILNQPIVDYVGKFQFIGAEIFSADFVKSMDYDGDGKADIILSKRGQIKVYNISKSYNIANQYVASLSGSLSLGSNQGIASFGDFNGDRKTDLLVVDILPTASVGRSDYNYSVHLSDGLYAFTPLGSIHSHVGVVPPDAINVADFDGNGLADISFAEKTISYLTTPTSYSTNLKIYYSRGTSFSYAQMGLPTLPGLPSTCNAGDSRIHSIGDFNGDGRSDILIGSCGDKKYHTLTFYRDVNNPLLENALDGFNRQVSFGYDKATTGTVYTKGSGRSYPINNVQLPMFLAKSMTQPDGIGGTNTTVYHYSDAWLHRKGLGFLGFGKVTSTNAILGESKKITRTKKVLPLSH